MWKVTTIPGKNPWSNFVFHVSSKETIVFKHGETIVNKEEHLQFFKREPMRYNIEKVEDD